ncbi:polysaccharide pyruvyl transferase CsaB [Heliobacterium mobile]|uniref:polysaccharide pyruvyl transferase CsaB n=1 Tax=Heliobacterium mobile TaxID=28064 RepID=UPI0014796BFC|nr:polysaccharide pyruvyl transferase CsaB [Heliobacterium mobile]
MATIVLSGYFGYNNAGDEALLKAMIAALRSKRPDIRIIVLSGQPALTRKDHQVIAVHRYNPLAIVAAILQADLIVSGGGSLLQDVTGKLTIPYYLMVVALGLLFRRKCMFYAQGIGPVNGRFGKALIKWVANRTDLITLRDAASAKRLQRMGVKNPSMLVTADPVFGLTPEEKKRVTDLQTGRAEAVFCLRGWKNGPDLEGACLKLAQHLLDRGWRVTFLPMHAEEDLAICRNMTRQLNHSRVQLIDEELHYENAINTIAESSLLVGVRLHSLLFATLLGIPIIGIAYDPKVTGFLNELGRPAFGETPELTGYQLIREFERILSNYEKEQQAVFDFAHELKNRALVTAQLAIELMEDKGPDKRTKSR